MIVLALIILAQNTHVVTVQILFWPITMSRIILVLFVLLIGMALGYWLAKSRR